MAMGVMAGRLLLLTVFMIAVPQVNSKDCRKGSRCGDDNGDCCYSSMICNEGQPEYLRQCFFGMAKEYHCCTYEEEAGAAIVIFIVIPVLIIIGCFIGCFCCWWQKCCCFQDSKVQQQPIPPTQGVQVGMQQAIPMQGTPGFTPTAAANLNSQPMQAQVPAAGTPGKFCSGCGAPQTDGEFCTSCGKRRE